MSVFQFKSESNSSVWRAAFSSLANGVSRNLSHSACRVTHSPNNKSTARIQVAMFYDVVVKKLQSGIFDSLDVQSSLMGNIAHTHGNMDLSF